MFCRVLIIAATLAAILPAVSKAEPAIQGPRWAYRGAGNDSCGKFVAATSGNAPGRGMAIKNLDGKEYFDQSQLYAEWI